MIRGITTVIALACALFIAACQEKDISGIYIDTFESGIYSHDGGEACEPPNKSEGEGGMCYEPIEVSNQLGLLKTDDGDLQFAVHLAFFNWHTCSMNGVAKKEGKAWVYRDDEFGDGCALSISRKGGEIVLNTDAAATCSGYCGMRGHFDNARFPVSSRVNDSPTSEDIACVTAYEDACDE